MKKYFLKLLNLLKRAGVRQDKFQYIDAVRRDPTPVVMSNMGIEIKTMVRQLHDVEDEEINNWVLQQLKELP
jgi:hypothetical protein